MHTHTLLFHHLGWLVRSIEKSREAFFALGYTQTSEIIFDALRGVKICFLEKDVNRIELIEQATSDSIVKNLQARYKNSIYHVCYLSKNLASDVATLRIQGFMPLDSEPRPAIALQNRKIIFLLHPVIGMVELLSY